MESPFYLLTRSLKVLYINTAFLMLIYSFHTILFTMFICLLLSLLVKKNFAMEIKACFFDMTKIDTNNVSNKNVTKTK